MILKSKAINGEVTLSIGQVFDLTKFRRSTGNQSIT